MDSFILFNPTEYFQYFVSWIWRTWIWLIYTWAILKTICWHIFKSLLSQIVAKVSFHLIFSLSVNLTREILLIFSIAGTSSEGFLKFPLQWKDPENLI